MSMNVMADLGTLITVILGYWRIYWSKYEATIQPLHVTGRLGRVYIRKRPRLWLFGYSVILDANLTGTASAGHLRTLV